MLLGNGYAHCPTSDDQKENTQDEDILDLNVSFTSLVPYSFVKVVEIPIAHPRDLPGIILNLRKAILIDTLCRSLNLHETVQENGGSSSGVAGGIGLLTRTGQGNGSRQIPGVAVGLGRKSGAPGGKGNAIGSNGAQVMISSNSNTGNEEGDETLIVICCCLIPCWMQQTPWTTSESKTVSISKVGGSSRAGWLIQRY